MRRWAGLLAVVALAGCGGTRVVTRPSPATPPSPATCNPPAGAGVMGACTPRPAGLQRLAAPAKGVTLIPDVSEYQPCGVRSKAIVRVYEAGTDALDSAARCHLAEAARHGWRGAYFFARGYRPCAYQADRFAGFVRSLGGANVYVIDAEVPMRAGFVRCLEARVRRDTGGVVVDYTSTGTASGGPFTAPLWLASYGARPGCIEGRCARVAWQFSDATNCAGTFGDCSIDEGITSLGRPKPRPARRGVLLAQRARLRSELVHYGCARRRHEGVKLGPKCRAMFARGDQINRELKGAR